MGGPIDAKESYLAAAAAQADRLPGNAHSWLRQLRGRARERFADAGFPTTRDEAWRYTNLAALTRQAFAPAQPDIGAVTNDTLRAASFDLPAHRLVFVGGRYQAALSDPPKSDGVVFAGSLADAMARAPEQLQSYLGEIGTVEIGALAALNTAFLNDGAFLHLAAKTVLERPIHLIHFAALNAMSVPRTLVVAGEESCATIVEHFVGFDGPVYFCNALTEIALAARAKLTYYRVQEESAQSFHVGGVHVRQARDSEFVSNAVDLGGLLVRNDLRTVLAEGATCALNGLYSVSGRQHVDNHTVIEHAAPRSTSRELYKGVLDGRARAVFNGRVLVHPDAQQTDAQQTNNNLLLSDDAEVDTKPELEIYADDVKCAHGATVGQLDPNQLYYLRTRAVDDATARDLLTFAFANDVLRRFKLVPLRAELDRRLMARLLRGRVIREVELV
ncbi:MAG TPA: Fe-S cluster assembly protein SufD [Burkholderiales bacterium]